VLKWLLHIIYLLSGIAAVLIGQVLPIFAARFDLNDLQLSYFFPAQFAGSLTGSFMSHYLGVRGRYVSAASVGGLLMASGMLVMNMDSYAACLGGFFVNGLGIGLSLPSINMLIAESEPERSGPALTFLNFCWGLGAIVCKPLVDAMSTANDTRYTLYVLPLPLFAAALMLLRRANLSSSRDRAQPADDTADVPIWRTSTALLIGLFNFIHVGFESGMGGWLTTYTGRIAGEPLLPWLSPTLLYFSCFVIGRGIAPAFFRFLDENRLLFMGLAIVGTGIALTLAADTVLLLSVGACVTGFGTSWIFPANVARFSKIFGPAANRRATPLFMAGTLGAAAVTWLIGFVSERNGDLRYGMFVLGASIAMLLVLQAILFFRTPVTADRAISDTP
jgi:MFS transporter, FHS family, glucose/mannose:H+ symporter